jgi:membrane-associated HD superfamily phosphohydrolase
VSILYVEAKLGDMVIVQVSGAIVVSLMVPLTITLLGYVREKAKRRTLISNEVILFYLSLELVLDYVLRIPFREILTIHVPYIIVFYAALFSMIGVSIEKNKKMASVVIITFLILMGCLIYYLLPI